MNNEDLINTKRKNPCHKCDKVGCGAYHDKCLAYQVWLAKNEKRKASIRRDKELPDSHSSRAIYEV